MRCDQFMLKLNYDETAKVYFKKFKHVTCIQPLYFWVHSLQMKPWSFESPNHCYNTRCKNEITLTHRVTLLLWGTTPNKIQKYIKNEINLFKFRKNFKEYSIKFLVIQLTHSPPLFRKVCNLNCSFLDTIVSMMYKNNE